MIERYEETTAEIFFAGDVSLNLAALAVPLNRRMIRGGFDFDVVGTVAGRELIFTGQGLTVSVSGCPDRPGVIRVSAGTPSGFDARATARDRHAASAAVVSHFTDSHPAEKVAWIHAGRCYETRPAAEGPVQPTRFRRPAELPEAALDAPGDLHDDALPAAPAETSAEIIARENRNDPLYGLREDLALRDETDRKASVPLKLAVYTMNTSLMVVSLPVGAGVLTYNLMKGGSMTATARAMALTGIAIAAGSLSSAQDFAAMASTALF